MFQFQCILYIYICIIPLILLLLLLLILLLLLYIITIIYYYYYYYYCYYYYYSRNLLSLFISLYLHFAYLAVMLCSLGLLRESLIVTYAALHFTSKLEVKLCRIYLSSCFALRFSQMQTCCMLHWLAQMLTQSAHVCINALGNGLEN